MAQINTCLKRLFVIFNVLFAIIGGVIIGLTMLSQVYISRDESSLGNHMTGTIILYVIGACIMLIALLGAHGAYKEHKVSLIVFLVCMVIGTMLMVRAGTSLAVFRPEIESTIEEESRRLLPLNTASYDVKNMANSLQTQMQCCGLFDVSDWNGDIPDSCMCSPTEEENKCKEVVYSKLSYFSQDVGSKKSVYRLPCFPIFKYYISRAFDFMIGLFFTLASLAVLGMILSSVMIHQLRHPNRPVILFTVPEVFTRELPKYEKLQSPPPPYEKSALPL